MDAKIIRRFPSGVVTPPPSKSLAHRAVLCAALAAPGGESVILNVDLSQDIAATLSGAAALGAGWRREADGVAVFAARDKSDTVDCGESGSTLRFLLPLAALGDSEVAFNCRGRLPERPLGIYEELFAKSGAAISRHGERITVRGPLRPGVFSLPGGVSSQFVSGLLLALPLLGGDSEIRLTTPLESAPYVDMTIAVMNRFGVEIERPNPGCFKIKGGQIYHPENYRVEADYSQAAYFLGAAALGCNVALAGLPDESLQGDRMILDVLRDMGARIERRGGLVRVRAERLLAVEVDARDIPDLVPPIAALCCFCEGESRIVNAARLRLKESDRLRAISVGLKNLGADIKEREDGLVITGTGRLRGGEVDSCGDHRIAMSLALAAIGCDGPVTLTGAESVNKSYPAFWRDFEKEERNG